MEPSIPPTCFFFLHILQMLLLLRQWSFIHIHIHILRIESSHYYELGIESFFIFRASALRASVVVRGRACFSSFFVRFQIRLLFFARQGRPFKRKSWRQESIPRPSKKCRSCAFSPQDYGVLASMPKFVLVMFWIRVSTSIRKLPFPNLGSQNIKTDVR